MRMHTLVVGWFVVAVIISGPVWTGESLTLKRVMKHLGQDMGRLNEAVLEEDFDEMEQAVKAIADHPPPDALERFGLMRRIGFDVSGFKEGNDKVNKAAKALEEAVQRRDMEAVVHHYALLMEGCVGCHSKFREKLRTTAASGS